MTAFSTKPHKEFGGQMDQLRRFSARADSEFKRLRDEYAQHVA